MRALPAALGLTLVLLGAALCLPARAGQVLSPADRDWAKKAVAEEKALAAPPGKATLAVLNFRNATGDPSLDPWQKGIPLLLVTDLASVPGLSVVERTRMQALVEELGLGASGLVEEGTAPRVGRLLGARWLVGGGIGRKAPPRIEVDSAVADVPSAKTAGSASAAGEIDRVFEIEKDLLFGILKAIDVTVTPEEEKRLRRPCSKNPAALSALFLGIDAGDRGDLDKAEGYFRRAVAADPSICVASDALKEIAALRAAAPPARRTKELLKTIREGTSLTDSLTTKEPLLRGGRPLEIPGARTSPTGVGVTFP